MTPGKKVLRFVLLLGLIVIFSANASSPIEFSFRWTPGQIEIPVSFDGRPPIWCILDSGSEFSMIDSVVAKELKLGPIITDGERERIVNLKLQIGSFSMPLKSITLWRLDNFRRQKREIRGLIGCELFERYVATIDFQKKIVLLHEPADFHPTPNSTSLPITFAGHLPVVQANLVVNGKEIPAKLMVDTGAQSALVLRYPYATKHSLVQAENERISSETVATGQRSFITLSIQALILDRWKFENLRTEAYGTPIGAGGDTSTDGLIGNDVLKRFRVTFDYSRKRMLLEENNSK